MEKHSPNYTRPLKRKYWLGKVRWGMFSPADPELLAYLWFVLPGGEKEADRPPSPGPDCSTEMPEGGLQGPLTGWQVTPRGGGDALRPVPEAGES